MTSPNDLVPATTPVCRQCFCAVHVHRHVHAHAHVVVLNMYTHVHILLESYMSTCILYFRTFYAERILLHLQLIVQYMHACNTDDNASTVTSLARKRWVLVARDS